MKNLVLVMGLWLSVSVMGQEYRSTGKISCVSSAPIFRDQFPSYQLMARFDIETFEEVNRGFSGLENAAKIELKGGYAFVDQRDFTILEQSTTRGDSYSSEVPGRNINPYNIAFFPVNFRLNRAPYKRMFYIGVPVDYQRFRDVPVSFLSLSDFDLRPLPVVTVNCRNILWYE